MPSAVEDLTQEMIDQFTEVMLYKTRFLSDDDLRGIIQQVIIDTWLMSTGIVPFERWVEADAVGTQR
jgi:hypothetical protein